MKRFLAKLRTLLCDAMDASADFILFAVIISAIAIIIQIVRQWF